MAEGSENYPNIPGERGFPLDNLIRTPGIHLVRTESGNTLRVDVGPKHLYIEEPNASPDDENAFRLNAEIDDYDGSMRLDLKTKRLGPEGKEIRHTDLDAKRFVRTALAHFDQAGHPVSIINTNWQKGEMNYDMFHRTLEETQDEVEAARQTWSGRVFRELGFDVNASTDVDTYGKPVYVKFTKVTSPIEPQA